MMPWIKTEQGREKIRTWLTMSKIGPHLSSAEICGLRGQKLAGRVQDPGRTLARTWLALDRRHAVTA
jgi:hypothetical protein